MNDTLQDRIETVISTLTVVDAALHGIEHAGESRDERDWVGLHQLISRMKRDLEGITADIPVQPKTAA